MKDQWNVKDSEETIRTLECLSRDYRTRFTYFADMP